MKSNKGIIITNSDESLKNNPSTELKKYDNVLKWNTLIPERWEWDEVKTQNIRKVGNYKFNDFEIGLVYSRNKQSQRQAYNVAQMKSER